MLVCINDGEVGNIEVHGCIPYQDKDFEFKSFDRKGGMIYSFYFTHIPLERDARIVPLGSQLWIEFVVRPQWVVYDSVVEEK